MTIVAGTENSRATSATAWAWLPDENATTPRARTLGSRRDRWWYAPRNLKAPMRWRFSHLSATWAPARSSSVRERTTGVRCATEPSARRASDSRWASASCPGAPSGPGARPASDGSACATLTGSTTGRSSEVESRLRLARRIERRVDLLGAQLRHLARQLAHRAPLLERALRDLRGAVVADEGIQRGRHARRDLDGVAARVRVRDEPGERLVGERARHVREQADALEQRARHQRQHGVEVELAPLRADRDRDRKSTRLNSSHMSI